MLLHKTQSLSLTKNSIILGKIYFHESFEDPAAVFGTDQEKLDAFRRIRDEIRDWKKNIYF
jgi:hypothetical protein